MANNSADLRINIDAEIAGAVAGVKKVDKAIQGLAQTVPEIASFNKELNKIGTTAFDVDKAIAIAQQRVSDSVDNMAAAALQASQSIESSGDNITKTFGKLPQGLGPTISAFDKLKKEAGSAAAVFTSSGFGDLSNKLPAALDKTAKGSARATQSLNDFSRILQDAPYGFIGISNNLNPALEGFQRLRKETGSTGSALKALGGSLIGAGGIGFALSAVTAAISFISLGFDRWKMSTKGASDEIKKAKEELSEFARVGGQDLGNLRTQLAVAENLNLSMRERKNAIANLRKDFGPYFKDLTDEQILNGNVAGAVARATDAIIAKARASAANKKLITLSEQELELNDKLTDSQLKLDAARRKAELTNSKKSTRSGVIGGSSLGMTGTEVTSSEKAAFAAADAMEAAQKETNEFATALANVKSQAKATADFISNSTVGTGDIFKEIKPAKERAVKAIKEVETHIKSLQIAELIDTTGVVPLIHVAAKYDQSQLKKDREAVVKMIREGFQAPVDAVKIGMTGEMQTEFDRAKKNIAEMNNLLLKQKEEMDSIIQGIASDSVGAFAEGIGNALSGVGNPFQGLANILANGLIAIGKQVIATSAVMTALKKALNSFNPALSLGAGVALVAIGTVLKNSLSKNNKFADGGVVNGPVIGQIGEQGQSEVIVPLSRLAGMLNDNNGNGGGTVEFEIRGDILVGVLNRALGSRGRAY